MAYATLMEFDVDLDTHIKLGEAVGDAPIKGLILHAGGPSERGVHSLDVWERKEDSERFFAERMVPALQAAGHRGRAAAELPGVRAAARVAGIASVLRTPQGCLAEADDLPPSDRSTDRVTRVTVGERTSPQPTR